jgi:hypothetical protein
MLQRRVFKGVPKSQPQPLPRARRFLGSVADAEAIVMLRSIGRLLVLRLQKLFPPASKSLIILKVILSRVLPRLLLVLEQISELLQLTNPKK